MTQSNLSKIKPKLRTTGRLSGNFGKNKVKAGSNNQIGHTQGDVGSLPTKLQSLMRLYNAYPQLTHRQQQSILPQIRQLAVQLNLHQFIPQG